MTILFEELKTILVERWAYPAAQVERVVVKLQSMDQELQLAFETYLESGVFPETPCYFGLSPAAIERHYSFKPPAVFMCLDWIRREPQIALEALVEEYKKPLPKGFDSRQLQEYLSTQQQADGLEKKAE